MEHNLKPNLVKQEETYCGLEQKVSNSTYKCREQKLAGNNNC